MERLRGFAALMNNRRLLLLIVALVIVSAFGVGTSIYALRHSRASAANPASKSNVIRFLANPEPAPPFVLRDLDGKIVSTEDWKGKVVILNFWATWCPPCRQEIPEFIRLQAAYRDKLQIVGASEDDDPPQKVREFVQKIGMNYPVVMATKELADNYGGALAGLPVDARIETFNDTGQVFLKNAASATELPDVDLSGLTPAQKKDALHRLNAETCTCGCNLTLAECRV